MQGSPEQVSGRASRRQCDVVSGCVLTQYNARMCHGMQEWTVICKDVQKISVSYKDTIAVVKCRNEVR